MLTGRAVAQAVPPLECSLTLVARTYTTGIPMVDAVVVDMGVPVELPTAVPNELFSFRDGGASRSVAAVYVTSEPLGPLVRGARVGRYVVVQLSAEENPDPLEGRPWHIGTDAGHLVEWVGGHSSLRRDFSALEVCQLADLRDVKGNTVRPAGSMPAPAADAVLWPEFEGFAVDEVFSTSAGDVHYSLRLPPDYDDAGGPYPLMVTLPGYNGMLFANDDGSPGANVYSDYAVVPWLRADPNLAILAPQVTDWHETSAVQVVELLESVLAAYAIDPERVYAAGYSAGGETLSRVVAARPELFAAYLHAGSQWDGPYGPVAKAGTAVRVAMAQNDDYYGAERAQEAYEGLVQAYRDAGWSQDETSQKIVLDLRSEEFCAVWGHRADHGAALMVLNDPTVTSWVLAQTRASL